MAETKRQHPLRVSYGLYLLSVAVGVLAGLGAVGFRALITFFRALSFRGEVSFAVSESMEHTAASTWGPFIVLVPAAGAMGVVFLVRTFAPEAKGHGVPEVMGAVYAGKGKIRPVVAGVKALASALSIGTGGAVGREGPVIQIGAALGSTCGGVFRLPPWKRITLVAAGAAAGIAATFNTPIGGMLFAIEIILHEVSARTLIPVGIATAVATYVGRFFFGTSPSFVIPTLEGSTHLLHPAGLLAFVGMGVLMGLVAWVYIRVLYGSESWFERLPVNPYLRHGLGMLLVGGMMYGCMRGLGHYYVHGVGYSTIQDILGGTLSAVGLLMGLGALKLVATSLTLGSGASGGVFSPALFMGATVGAAYGIGLHDLFPGLELGVVACAVAGMAALVGGATGAPMMAIVMTFEMTRDYQVILPMTLAVVLSYGVRRVIGRHSIYTFKLARRGEFVPDALQANFNYIKHAEDVMSTGVATMPSETPLERWRGKGASEDLPAYVVATSGGEAVGFARRDAVLSSAARSPSGTALGDVVQSRFVRVVYGTPILGVLAILRDAGVRTALVVNGGQPPGTEVVGVITPDELQDAVEQAVELFAD